ncbi:acetate--CoA ligase family protein [Pseudomonas lopnurensis]|uniref:acetate--CoA ligase family protein n=1 Tax=Pseudomonas lopnurensis TaxID=1477517 RepID=UPI0028AF7B13|nr:acetate--CoA ligase family protein [Pseudomonas lopnurensis]
MATAHGIEALTGAALMKAMLRPCSVALVGVSDDTGKTAARPLLFMRRAGFKGTIYCVNPSREQVQGERAYTSLSELPERPEHVFILTSSELAIAAVEECGRLGIGVATILAGGFSESGPEGVARETRLKEAGLRAGVRLIGPSSIGVVNLHERLMLTANAAFAEPELRAGGVFCASHSGSLIGALTSRGIARGFGFHSLVSVGSEVDLSIGEICNAALDDPSVTGYLLFLESLRHAEQLRAFALEAARRGKPVAAYKLGRSQAAAELAVSHTGALAGEDAVADAFLSDCGIARLETFEGLLEALPLLARLPLGELPRRPRVGVVTTTGGGAAMAVDQLGIRGIDVVAPSEATLARLAASGIEVNPGRIVDLTLAGTRYDVMKATLDVLLEAPEFDLVLAAVGSSARTRPELAVKPVIDSRHHSRPLACFIVPEAPEALRLLNEAGVPCFRSPEGCGDVIAAAFRRRRPGNPPPAAHTQGRARTLDEASAYRVLNELGVPSAPCLALDVDAPIPPLPFDFPVVVKVLHAEIAHKTDVGGVVLNVRNREELEQAIARIRFQVKDHRPDVAVRQVLVQAQTRGVGEVLIGYRRDPEVGPLVMLAAGGVLTELYQDRSLRLAPVDLTGAWEMIDEVRGLRALAGYRGGASADLEGVARALSALSQLANKPELGVVEAEINPLIVLPDGQGVLAVDGLIYCAEVQA